jgi:hypothetical protein
VTPMTTAPTPTRSTSSFAPSASPPWVDSR